VTAKKFAARPDTVVIGHQTFSIAYMTEDEWSAERWPDEAAGVTSEHRAFIGLRLEDEVTENKLRERLLHEIMHACWAVSNLTHLIDMDGGLPNDGEESIMLIQTPPLLMVLRENPHVVKYLTDSGR
jgi:hypothetical protein